MAEAAGLALGVAGIIASFKGTVDLFNLLADARNQGREHRILETKLDVEKMLLLRWADGVNLLSDDYDRRLDDTNMQVLVVRILSSIAELLTSEPNLRCLYGLAEAPTESGMAVEPVYSKRRCDRFLQRYQALSLQVPIRHKPTIPIHRRIRWVVRDREKFGKLVGELENFRVKLNELVPIPNGSCFNRMMDDEDVRYVKGLPKLNMLLDASRGSQNSIAESAQQAITKTLGDRILATLWFRRIDERRESISEAHFQTLQWVFEPPTLDYPWDDLVEWLSHGTGIYWVSGKAGSGKSTLMKHIYSTQRTHDLLKEWAGEEPIHVGHFFFMTLGTADQKTQEGLARTLLYQILSFNPSLIPEALPNMWRELYNNMHKDECAIELPSLAEIKYAFRIISNSTERLGKVCLFVDGLDEFDGDLASGIAFIKSLTVNSSIKAIVSSRPIPACVAAFDGLPTLALHDLNLGDIASYVYDTVGSHDYLRTLIARNGEEGDSIITDIIAKSSGVFLWVILACRALLSGFADHDRLPELRRRVDELPPELEDMFQHMLYKINERHREEGSRLLRLCYMHQKAPWPDATKDIYALGIAMISDDRDDHDDLFQFNRLNDSEKEDLYAEMQGRLRSRCGGLLELHHKAPSKIDESIDPAFESNPRPKILFMHRTVFEFLNDQKVWNLACLKIRESQLDVSTLLAHYNLHLAIQDPTARRNPRDHSGFAAFIWDGLRWALQQGGESFFSKLREFLAHENATRPDPTASSRARPSRTASAQLFSKELLGRSEMLSLDRTLISSHNDIAEKWDSKTNIVKVGLKRSRDGRPVKLPVACLWCRMMRMRVS